MAFYFTTDAGCFLLFFFRIGSKARVGKLKNRDAIANAVAQRIFQNHNGIKRKRRNYDITYVVNRMSAFHVLIVFHAGLSP